jgi:hypothetical protein
MLTGYSVIYFGPQSYQVVAAGLETLQEAKSKRVISGDVVVHHGTTVVVKDPSWLWDWERDNPQSYAYRMTQRNEERPLTSREG